jgi:hypothetical protein
LQLASDASYVRRRIDPANIDTSNQWCLGTLLPVLFPNINYGERGERIVVWQGIPFHTVVIRGGTGAPGGTGPLVDRAKKEGNLLEQPLRPADDPLAAADTLFAKLAQEENPAHRTRPAVQQHLREQAWRAIRHLVDPGMEKPPRLSSDASWKRLKEKAASMNIRWDEQKQEYVAGAKPE